MFSRWILVPGQEHLKTGGVYLVLALRRTYSFFYYFYCDPGLGRVAMWVGVRFLEKKKKKKEWTGSTRTNISPFVSLDWSTSFDIAQHTG